VRAALAPSQFAMHSENAHCKAHVMRNDSLTRPVKARDYVHDRMCAIEAAMNDLHARDLAFPSSAEMRTSAYQHRLRNRIMAAVLNLNHLRDDARRLAKHVPGSPEDVSRMATEALSLRVLKNLSDSWKHGIGGRNPRGAVLNGILMVERAPQVAGPANDRRRPDSRVHILGMVVADAKEGSCCSSTLLEDGIRRWGAFLEPWIPDAREWAARCTPAAAKLVVLLAPGKENVVPLGAVAVVELPENMREALSSETRRRIQEIQASP
jgi:hypothetical protein